MVRIVDVLFMLGEEHAVDGNGLSQEMEICGRERGLVFRLSSPRAHDVRAPRTCRHATATLMGGVKHVEGGVLRPCESLGVDHDHQTNQYCLAVTTSLCRSR